MNMPTEQSAEIPVPQSRFKSAEIEVTDRYDAWCDSLTPMFRPTLASDVKPADIFVSSDFFLLGETLMGTTAMKGVGGAHNPGSTPLRDTHELFVIECILRGSYTGYNSSRLLSVRAGDISILEPGRGLSLVTEPNLDVLNFIVPRNLLLELSGDRINFHSRVIRRESLAGQILRQAMMTTREELPHQSFFQAKEASRMLLGAIAGLVRDGESHAEDSAVDFATLNAICAYIERNLNSPELGPDHLCRRFHCSRARLYRLFAPLDGVANYIRKMRLERCHAELLSASRKVKVSDMAMEWGFGSISTFNRLFREAFGITPGEVKSAAMEQDDRRKHNSSRLSVPEYYNWLENL